MKWAHWMCSLVFVGLLFPQSPLLAMPDDSGTAELWLKKMSTAFSELNFRGLVVYGDGEHWESLEYRQSLHGDSLFRRTDYLTGMARTQIRHDNQLFCIHSGKHTAGLTPDVFKPLNRDLADKLPTILRSYDVHLATHTGGTSARIAAHDVVFVTLTPKSDDRYGYQLWLERTTGLPLKVDLLDIEGHLLQRVQFAEIELGAVTPISLFSSHEGGHALRLTPSSVTQLVSASEAHWQPTWLPDGFELQGHNLRDDVEGQFGERFIFSDGLSSVTVFIDQVSDEVGPDLIRNWHGTSASVRHTHNSAGDFRISVVGELPPSSVVRINQAVRLADQLASH